MSCDVELVALLAGDDLPPLEQERVEAHVAECRECRELLAEFRALRSATVDLRDEELPSIWPRVRSAVQPRPRRRWFWAAALAAAAGVAAWVFWPSQRVVLPPLTAPRLIATAPDPPRPVVAKVVRHRRVLPRRVEPRRVQPASEPLVVKMLTDDPNVVIYWVVEGTKGD